MAFKLFVAAHAYVDRCREKFNTLVKQSNGTTVSKEIIDKVKGDLLQCCSLGSNRERFCDFTVVVGDTEFPCHRFVLSACSGFFEALLRSGMKESREMRATIQGISPEIFKCTLDIIYGCCEVLVPEKMIDIWKASHQLQINPLISACESFFMNNINFDNCNLIYFYAQLLQSPQVTSSVLNFMVLNFYSFVQSENFVELNYEDLLQIIQNENLQTCTDFKIEAILKWCDAENKTNKNKSSKSAQDSTGLSFLGNLLEAVDLAKITASTLASLLTDPLIQEDTSASSAIISQAAKKLAKPSFRDFHRYNTGEKNCPHCKASNYFDDSDSDSDSDY